MMGLACEETVAAETASILFGIGRKCFSFLFENHSYTGTTCNGSFLVLQAITKRRKWEFKDLSAVELNVLGAMGVEKYTTSFMGVPCGFYDVILQKYVVFDSSAILSAIPSQGPSVDSHVELASDVCVARVQSFKSPHSTCALSRQRDLLKTEIPEREIVRTPCLALAHNVMPLSQNNIALNIKRSAVFLRALDCAFCNPDFYKSSSTMKVLRETWHGLNKSLSQCVDNVAMDIAIHMVQMSGVIAHTTIANEPVSLDVEFAVIRSILAGKGEQVDPGRPDMWLYVDPSEEECKKESYQRLVRAITIVKGFGPDDDPVSPAERTKQLRIIGGSRDIPEESWGVNFSISPNGKIEEKIFKIVPNPEYKDDAQCTYPAQDLSTQDERNLQKNNYSRAVDVRRRYKTIKELAQLVSGNIEISHKVESLIKLKKVMSGWGVDALAVLSVEGNSSARDVEQRSSLIMKELNKITSALGAYAQKHAKMLEAFSDAVDKEICRHRLLKQSIGGGASLTQKTYKTRSVEEFVHDVTESGPAFKGALRLSSSVMSMKKTFLKELPSAIMDLFLHDVCEVGSKDAVSLFLIKSIQNFILLYSEKTESFKDLMSNFCSKRHTEEQWEEYIQALVKIDTSDMVSSWSEYLPELLGADRICDHSVIQATVAQIIDKFNEGHFLGEKKVSVKSLLLLGCATNVWASQLSGLDALATTASNALMLLRALPVIEHSKFFYSFAEVSRALKLGVESTYNPKKYEHIERKWMEENKALVEQRLKAIEEQKKKDKSASGGVGVIDVGNYGTLSRRKKFESIGGGGDGFSTLPHKRTDGKAKTSGKAQTVSKATKLGNGEDHTSGTEWDTLLTVDGPEFLWSQFMKTLKSSDLKVYLKLDDPTKIKDAEERVWGPADTGAVYLALHHMLVERNPLEGLRVSLISQMYVGMLARSLRAFNARLNEQLKVSIPEIDSVFADKVENFVFSCLMSAQDAQEKDSLVSKPLMLIKEGADIVLNAIGSSDAKTLDTVFGEKSEFLTVYTDLLFSGLRFYKQVEVHKCAENTTRVCERIKSQKGRIAVDVVADFLNQHCVCENHPEHMRKVFDVLADVLIKKKTNSF